MGQRPLIPGLSSAQRNTIFLDRQRVDLPGSRPISSAVVGCRKSDPAPLNAGTGGDARNRAIRDKDIGEHLPRHRHLGLHDAPVAVWEGWHFEVSPIPIIGVYRSSESSPSGAPKG